MKRLLAVAFVLAALPAFALTHYAITRITNRSAKTVTFRYRWGPGPWQRTTLKPRKEKVIAWRFTRPGDEKCPWLTVEFAMDRKRPGVRKPYRVASHACEDKKGSCGRRYAFVDGDEPRYVELHDEE